MRTTSVSKEDMVPHLGACLWEARRHVSAHCAEVVVKVGMAYSASHRGFEVQVSVFWRQGADSGQEVVWDRFNVRGFRREEFVQREEEILDVCDQHQADLVFSHAHHADPPLPSIPVLFRYHPFRLRALRPYGKMLARIGADGAQLRNEDVSQAARRALWLEELARARLPLRQRIGSERTKGRTFQRHADMLAAYAYFCAELDALFDFPAHLTSMLRATDHAGVRLDDLDLPHAALYLHFGRQDDLQVGAGWTCDGAYVFEHVREDGSRWLMVSIVAAPPTFEAFADTDECVEPVYHAAVCRRSDRRSVGRLLTSHLYDQLNNLSRTDFAKMMAEDAAAATQAKEELHLLLPRQGAYLEMLKLVANALAYLSRYPEDIQTRWSAGAPPELAYLAQASDSPRIRERARKELEEQGYAPVRACGAGLEARALRNAQVRAWHVLGRWERQGYDDEAQRLVWMMPSSLEQLPGYRQLAQDRASRMRNRDDG